MSSSSFDSMPSLPPLATLTIQELSDLCEDENLHPLLDRAFTKGHVSTTNLRQFTFISHSIQKMEKELLRFKLERAALFDDLMDSQRFVRNMSPILRHHRRPRSGNHPYRRHSSSSSPRSVVILPEEVDALHLPPTSESPTTTTDSLPSYFTACEELGTRRNPIVIESEDDVEVCARCHQPGHTSRHCNTLMRSFTNCLLCEWTNQQECDHYDFTPEWIHRQQEMIDHRG